MRPIRERFKTFGGEFIDDIVLYLKNYINQNPSVTISIGCDSVQKRRKTIYALTIMLYRVDFKNGAHVVFFRDNQKKIRDNFERLHGEVLLVKEVAELLESELETFYERNDLTPFERRKYKFHLNKCNGEYLGLDQMNEQEFIRNMNLSDHETNEKWRLVDIHLDFNPFERSSGSTGLHRNKSYDLYRSFVPWLRGLGYRVWVKPNSPASSSAADLLLQD
jgi:predicted RNase H-related nuclease YkuK (DUF458 family)